MPNAAIILPKKDLTNNEQTTPANVISQSEKNILVSQIIKYIPGSLFPALLYLVSSGIYTRLFRADEYGKYFLLLNTSLMFSALACQWLQQGINRFLPGIDQSLVRGRIKSSIGFSLIAIIFPVCIILSIIICALAFYRYEYFKLIYLIPCITLLVVTSIYTPLLVVLQASMRAGLNTTYQMLDASFRFAFGLLIIYFVLRDPISLLWANTVSLLILIPFVWRTSGMPNPTEILGKPYKSVQDIRSFMHYGLPLTGWYFTFTLLNFGDRYIVEYSRGASEVGIYSANYGLVVGAVGLFSAPILTATHPFLISSWNQKDYRSAGIWLGRIMEWFLQFGILIISFLVVFGQDIAKVLLGEGFREGWKVMPIVFAGLVVWQLGMYAHKPLEFTGKTRAMLILGIIAGASNIVLNILLVPIYGYMAAAYITVISYFIYTVLTLCLGRRILQIKFNWQMVFIRATIIVMVFWIIQLIRSLLSSIIGINMSGIVTLLFAFIASAIIITTLIKSTIKV